MYGVLEIVNVNTVLLQLVCTKCKSTKVQRTIDGGVHCFVCNTRVQVVEISKLDGELTKPDRSIVFVSIIGIRCLTCPFHSRTCITAMCMMRERSLYVFAKSAPTF